MSDSNDNSPSGTGGFKGHIDIPGEGVFPDLDSAILYFIPLIETELHKLANTSDPELHDAIQKNETAFKTSVAHIIKENNLCKAFKLDLFNAIDSNPVNAFIFAQMLPFHAEMTGYGKPAHYIEKVATNDVYGDAIKMTMRMARNKAILEPLGVDVERYNYPRSQYLRDPLGFYQSMYGAPMWVDPEQVKDQLFPQTSLDQYTNDRTKELTDAGYDVTKYLPAQLDELYSDLKWRDIDPIILERIGLDVVKNAVNTHVKVIGNGCYVIGRDGKRTLFATLNGDGLDLHANDVLVAQLLDIINRTLYGNIGTTKFDNPLNTDQMVYGIVELLSMVTPQNADALKSTLLGAGVLDDLLNRLQTAWTSGAHTLFDTGMDRNDPTVWGGAGSDTKPESY